MASVRANKIASVVCHLRLRRNVPCTEQLESRSGNVVVARILSDKRVYNQLELVSGRMSPIEAGDVIVGALGRRRALKGFVGEVPGQLEVGDRLNLLNMGGVIGVATAVNKDFGSPAVLEVLGMAVDAGGRILNVADVVLPPVETLSGRPTPPVVLVSGTCMNSGKTFACSQVIKEFSERGYRVHGGKLTGVACRRDAISMEDHGALRTASFLEVGYPSTAGLSDRELVRVAMTVIDHLRQGDANLIVLELGDGIIGDYGLMPILESDEIRDAVKAHIFCAGDLVGAWGGQHFLGERGIPIDIISGPSTDTSVGVEYIEGALGVPAINARLGPDHLALNVLELLGLPAERSGARTGEDRGQVSGSSGK